MSIEDGNDAVGAGAQVPVLDENRIIDGLFNRFAASVPAGRQEPARDAVVELYSNMKARGLDDDVIAAQIDSFTKSKQETESVVQREIAKQAMLNRNASAADTISNAIRAYEKEDPRIGKLSSSIRDAVQDKYNANPQRIGEWQRNYVNKAAIEAIVDEVVEDLSKSVLGLDKPKNGAAPGKSGQQDKAAESESKGGKIDESELSDHQLDFYNTKVSNLQRWNHLSKEDAEKKAFVMAKSMPKPPSRSR